jgi:predicted N-formylglutamate amidohydrolase
MATRLRAAAQRSIVMGARAAARWLRKHERCASGTWYSHRHRAVARCVAPQGQLSDLSGVVVSVHSFKRSWRKALRERSG